MREVPLKGGVAIRAVMIPYSLCATAGPRSCTEATARSHLEAQLATAR